MAGRKKKPKVKVKRVHPSQLIPPIEPPASVNLADTALRAPDAVLEPIEDRPKPDDQPLLYHVYSDGSFRPPHFGAWSFVVVRNNKVIDHGSGLKEHTTINQMEMTAVLEALKSLPHNAKVVIFSDSQYTVKTFTSWAWVWKKSGWKTATGADVKNVDLICQVLLEQARFSQVKYQHVYGHNGNIYNEFADMLAQTHTYKALRNWYRNKAITPVTAYVPPPTPTTGNIPPPIRMNF